jgi:hypothetical protein
MTRDMTFTTASGATIVVPGVVIGEEWRVENELWLLLGEPVTRKEEE